MTDAYTSAIAAPGTWMRESLELQDAVAVWAKVPRRPDQLIGPLHRPGIAGLRAALRVSSQLPGVNLRWARGATDRAGDLVTGRSPAGALGAIGLDYLFEAAAAAGGPGRSAIALLRALAPQLAAAHRSDHPTTPPPMPIAAVRNRMDAGFLRRLRDLDDEAFASTEYDQMHRAVLDDGRACTVTVSRPGVARELIGAAHLLAPSLLALEVIDRSPWSAGSVNILRDATAAAVRRSDQQAVALDAVVLAAALERAGIDDLRVAQPIPELVNRRTAVFVAPESDAHQPGTEVAIGAGIATTLETGLVHGVYVTHPDRRHLRSGPDGIPTFVGGTSLGTLAAGHRHAFVTLLTDVGRADVLVDVLVDLGVVPTFVDRGALGQLLADSAILDPTSLVLPGAPDRRRNAARELVLRHGLRPTPALTSFALALIRLFASMQTDTPPVPVPKVAMYALPRLAGIGARAIDASNAVDPSGG